MTRVQILDSEKLVKYADFDNCEVWLLNRDTGKKLDERIINVPEITENTSPSSVKFPQLMTELLNKHPVEDVYGDVEVLCNNEDGTPLLDENGQRVKKLERQIIGYEMTFEYEVITKSKEDYTLKMYVCDEKLIKEVK